MTLIRNVLPKLRTSKNVVKQISKKERFRVHLDKQQVKCLTNTAEI